MDKDQEKRSWSLEEESLRRRGAGTSRLWIVGLVALVFVLGTSLVFFFNAIEYTGRDDNSVAEQKAVKAKPRSLQIGQVAYWWGDIPEGIVANAVHSTGPSNIHPQDYAGPDSCEKCHQENYNDWAQHPHRWMNAYADESTVTGDFSGASISYLGGVGTFEQTGDKYFMTLERDDIRRVYEISQTIGSRFYQYYIGKLIDGPEQRDHEFYAVDHVLPFGYWFEENKWVPVVHTHRVTVEGELTSEDEQPDKFRSDPFIPPSDELEFVPYHSCNQCHSTFALGHLFISAPDVLGMHAPDKMNFSMSDYVGETHPELWDPKGNPGDVTDDNFIRFSMSVLKWEAPEYAVSLGITCEACHMGSKEHALEPEILPKFFPNSPHLHVEGSTPIDFGRTHQNVNWICGRCHAGYRPQLAAGMSTWNSTEYSDAIRGSCYSELKCIDCHNPHQKIGQKWSMSPQQDDQTCIRCHEHLTTPDQIAKHTHHPFESEGSRCMNCHMPRLMEGLQDVVRTHMIFSPTNPAMIESNQPNACNLCHTDQPIDWTMTFLKEWYGASYSEEKIAKNYPNRETKTSLGWLQSEHPSVRLLAADSLGRTHSHWALPQLVDALDDPVLLNRQFTAKALEQMLDIKLDSYGYQFYMTPEERREPISEIRDALLPVD